MGRKTVLHLFSYFLVIHALNYALATQIFLCKALSELACGSFTTCLHYVRISEVFKHAVGIFKRIERPRVMVKASLAIANYSKKYQPRILGFLPRAAIVLGPWARVDKVETSLRD
jgi:hypothetical protein